jgi:NADH-quinone oxidoreductase subunit M
MGSKIATILLLGFLVAFLVKLPSFPVHGWFPPAFKEVPLVAICSGLLIKTGAYGIIRFAIPFFSESSVFYNNALIIIGVITILYGAFMAFSQDDLRTLAAYIVISHMGFILVGLFSLNEIAWQGVILQMIMSAVSTTALLIFASLLLKRTGTCNLTQLGGLFENSPVLSGLGMFFIFAVLGLPGTGNFIAEFFILSGLFKTNILFAILASSGLVLSAAYSLRIIQKIITGPRTKELINGKINFKEKLVMGILALSIFCIGLYPGFIINRSKPVVNKILNICNLKNEDATNSSNKTLNK